MATYYWVGGTGTWDGTTTTNWSLTSGGAGGAGVPTTADNVYINSSSGTGTITLSDGHCLNADFTGYSGTVTDAGSGTFLSVSGNFTLTNSTTWLGLGDLRYEGAGSSIWNFNGTDIGSGFLSVSSSGTLTISTGFTSTKLIQITTSGCVLNLNSTVTAAIAHTAGTLVINSPVYALYYNTNSTTSRTLVLNTNFTITANSTSNSLLDVTGAGLTITDNGHSIIISNSASTGTSSIIGAGFTFYSLLINRTMTPNLAITGANTYTILTIAPTTNSTAVVFSANQTVSGTFTSTGVSQSNRNYIGSQTAAVTISANLTVLSNTDFESITGSGTASWTGTSLGDCGNNSGITFTAAVNRYAVVNNSSFNAIGWATSSGGSTGATMPLPQDTAYFDANTPAGTYNLQSSVSYWRTPAIICTGFVYTLALSANTVFYGGVILNSTMTFTNGGYSATFSGARTYSITSASQTFYTVNFGWSTATSPSSAVITLADSFVATSTITLYTGSLIAQSNVQATSFTSTSTIARSLSMGSNTWTLSGTGTVWNLASSALTFSGASATIVLSDSTTVSKTFAGGSLTYGTLSIGGTTGIAVYIITGANTFNTVTSTKQVSYTIILPGSTTTTVGTWSAQGANNYAYLTLSSSSGQATLSKSGGGTVTVAYANVSYLTGSPALTWYVNTGSISNTVNWYLLGQQTKTVLITSGTSFTIPTDFGTLISVEAIGGGGAGGTGAGYGGGGGGAYAKSTCVTGLSPGLSTYVSIGQGGGAGMSGTATWFNAVANTAPSTFTQGVLAQGGQVGTGSCGGAGGSAATSVGTQRWSGGSGGRLFSIGSASGGGGAAGPNGTGGTGGRSFFGICHAGGGGGGSGGTLSIAGSAGSQGGSTNGGAGGGTGGGAGGVASAGSPGTAGSGGGGGGGAGTSSAGYAGGAGATGSYWICSASPSVTAGSGGGGGGAGYYTASTASSGAGGLYGGGGGGTANSGTSPGAGANGIIVFTYQVSGSANNFLTFF